jgi:hypothetical protein
MPKALKQTALEAEAALAAYLAQANLWPDDARTIDNALDIIRKDAR